MTDAAAAGAPLAGIRSVAVIGGGIVGLAAAWRLLQARPGLAVTVLEKEPRVAAHQSGRNSGVLHAGLHYAPGSARARLAVAGRRQMLDFCRAHGVAHDVCGKVVVAVDAAESARLAALHERGTRNGLHGLRRLTPAELREIEPHAAGVAALHVPDEGIVDYPGVCAALVREIARLGGAVRTGAAVTALRRDGAGWAVETTAGGTRADLLVNCAGLHADRVARLAGERPALRIVPFRGEYRRLRPERAALVRHLVYPVPDPALPFLGVHLTRRLDGTVDCGPNAVLALAREGYRWGDVSPRDLADALAFPGLWRFLARHPGATAAEVARSVHRRRFADALRRLVPAVADDDLLPGAAGVRAQAMLPDGTLVHDFVVVARARAVHVLNAPSPAATASLAIGEAIARAAGEAVGGA